MTPAPAPVASLTIGTRGSPLALAQTRLVAQLLATAWPDSTWAISVIETHGDRTQASGEPLPAIGGKGLFTAELEEALRSGEIDVAVHSLKDLPTAETPGLALGAVCAREDPRDCLVSRAGGDLSLVPEGASVGTSSLRRAAQLRALRPDLAVQPVRGNVGTRVRKVRDGDLDAVVVAAAGMRRLGLEVEVAEWFPADTFLPAPGQGALAIQCRSDDEATLATLAAVDDPGSRTATSAERAFLAALDAGCSAPVGAFAEAEEAGLRLSGLVASVDGRRVVRVAGTGTGPEALGERLARDARAGGAFEILDEIRG